MSTNNQKLKTNDFAEFDFADDIQVKDGNISDVEAQNLEPLHFEPLQKVVQNSPHVERIIAQQLSSQQASLSQKSKTATKGGQEKTDGWFKKIFVKKKVETKRPEKKPIAEIVRFAYEPEIIVEAQNLEPVKTVETQNLVSLPLQAKIKDDKSFYTSASTADKSSSTADLRPNTSLKEGKIKEETKEGKIKEQEGKTEEIKPKISVPDQIVSVLSESFKKVEPKTLEILKKEEKGVEVKKIEPAQTKVVLPKQEVKSEIDGNREINRNKETEKLEIAKNKVDIKKGVEKIPSLKKKSGFFSRLFKKDLEKIDQPIKIGVVSSPKFPNLKISEIEKIKPEAQKEFSYAVSMDKLLAGYDGAQYFKKEIKTQNVEPIQKRNEVEAQNLEPLQIKQVPKIETKDDKSFYTFASTADKSSATADLRPNPFPDQVEDRLLKEGKTEEKSKEGKIKEETMEGKMEEELKEGKEEEEKKEFSYAVTMDKLLAGYDGAQYFKKEVESKKIHTTISKNQLLQQKPAVEAQKAVGAQDFEPVQTKDISIVEGKIKEQEGKTKKEQDEERKFALPRKREIQNREDESLVYDKKDAEELSEIKTVSGPIVFKEEKVEDFHIAELVRRLVKDIKIVNGLKINMIERLNMIIDSYLRDVRTGVETKFLLKKSVEEGGMGFSADQVDQIMSIVSATHKQIHLTKGASEVITSKTAKENQLGIFSESIKKPLILPTVNQDNAVGTQNLVPAPTVKVVKKESWLKKLFGGKKKIEIDRNVGAQNLEPVQKLIQAKVVLPKQEIKSFYTSSSTADLRPNPSLQEGKVENRLVSFPDHVEDKLLKEGKNIEEKKELPVEIKPNLAKLRSSIDINNNKPKMEDIKIVRPHLTGPIEELAEMTIMDFRRLAPTIEDVSLKIIEKIGLINQESFSKHLAGINAWRASQPNQLYLKMGRDIIMNNQDIVELINKAKEEKKTVLSLSEFKMINQMNRGFRF